MAKVLDLEIKEIEGLLTAFEKAPKLVNKRLAIAARTCAQGIQDHARTHHRFISVSNAAENSIETDEQKGINGAVAYARVFINPNIKHAIYQHEGTGKYGPKGQPYDIFPVNKKMLRFVTSPGTAFQRAAPYQRFHKDGFTFAKGVTHPGVKGDPFLYNAADAKHSWCLSVFNEQIRLVLKEMENK